MTTKRTLFTALTLAGLATIDAGRSTAVAQGTAFTFQGFLADSGGRANGTHDFTFTLYDAASGGSTVGTSNVVENLPLTNGVFTVLLDFDAGVFTGLDRWLEIAVRPGTRTGNYTNLNPRQKLTATPYALFAGGANAAGIAGTVADHHLSENIARLNSNAVFTGAVAFSNAFGQFTGEFAGNGAGVTNVSLATLNSGGSIAANSNSFALLASYGVAGDAIEVVTADVNRDGWVDLISANTDPNSLTVFTNNGGGGFALATNVAVAPEAVTFGLVATDINSDGWMDLVRAIRNNETLLVLTNNGRGDFAVASTPATGGNMVDALVATDLNGDGRPELVVNARWDSLTVLTNAGHGHFVTSSTPAAYSRSLAAADVNEDGAMDMISVGSADNALTVLTNDGRGVLIKASSVAVTPIPGRLVAVDINGDGHVDVINGNYSLSLTVLTNDGKGGFVVASTPSAGGSVYSVAAMDFNGNGRMDLICANYFYNTLTILTNDGSAGFPIAATVKVGEWPLSVVTADVNRDGRTDLITANAVDGSLTVLVNTSLNFLGNFSGHFTGNASGLTGISRLDAPDGFPAPALSVNINGNVGIGTTNATEKLTITGVTSYNTGLKLTGDSVGGTGMALENTSPGGHKFDLISGGTADGIGVGAFGLFDETMGLYRFSVGPGGNVGIGIDLPSQKLHVIGNILASGTITPNSDVRAKADFAPVNTDLILERVANLSIQQWRFKAEPAEVKHVGPMAQDFRAAFGLGEIPTAIATVDADGVALAAIQALNRKLEEQRAENAALQERLAGLEELVRKLSHQEIDGAQ